MSASQITARLSKASKEAFEKYAQTCWLANSELAQLLILREQHRRRLPALRDGSKSKLEGSMRLTVTAHVPIVHVAEFNVYAESLGLSRSRALSLLLEQELMEQWLKTSIERP